MKLVHRSREWSVAPVSLALLLVACGGSTSSSTQSATYHITYSAAGVTSGTVPIDAAAYQQGQTVTVLGNPGNLAKAGYAFVGWSQSPGGATAIYSQGQTFAIGPGDVTLYAQWQATYTVTYDGNGNTGGTVPVDSSTYQQFQTITVIGNTNGLAKPGNAFSDWNTAADGTGTAYAPGDTFPMGSSDVVLYAQWSALPTYTVSYICSGCTGMLPVDSNAYFAGQPVIVLGNPGNITKAGFTFIGWNQNCAGTGTTYAAGQTFPMPAVSIALCADWSANPTFTVTYNGNGNTGGSAPIDAGKYQAGQTVTVLGNPGNMIKSGGSVFSGWNTAANGTGGAYTQGTTFSMGTTNVTLYATWSPAKLVFVTSLAIAGGFGGFPFAISQCAMAAASRGLTGTYLPWLSDAYGFSPASSFTRSSIPYVDVLGHVIANDWADLVSGTLRHSVSYTEAGVLASAYPVWTFTKPDGTATMTYQTNKCLLNTNYAYNDCDFGAGGGLPTSGFGWMTTGNIDSCPTGTKASLGEVGTPGSTTATWTNLGTSMCSNLGHFYCFQQ